MGVHVANVSNEVSLTKVLIINNLQQRNCCASCFSARHLHTQKAVHRKNCTVQRGGNRVHAHTCKCEPERGRLENRYSLRG